MSMYLACGRHARLHTHRWCSGPPGQHLSRSALLASSSTRCLAASATGTAASPTSWRGFHPSPQQGCLRAPQLPRHFSSLVPRLRSGVLQPAAAPFIPPASHPWQLTMSLTVPPLLALAAYNNLGIVSLFAYYAAAAACDGVSSCSSSLSQAFVADVISPPNRAAAFSLTMAAVSLALLLGPFLGTRLPSVQAATWLAIAGASLSVLYVAIFVPEPLTAERRAQLAASKSAALAEAAAAAAAASAAAAAADASAATAAASDAEAVAPHTSGCELPPLGSLPLVPAAAPERAGSRRYAALSAALSSAVAAPLATSGLNVALRSPLFRRLTALVVISGFCETGLSDVTTQYLQMRLTFGPKLQATYMQIYGVVGLLVQA